MLKQLRRGAFSGSEIGVEGWKYPDYELTDGS